MEAWSRHDTYKTNGVYRTHQQSVVLFPEFWQKK